MFELTRILVFLLGSYGTFTLGLNNKRLRLAFYGIAGQFAIRAFLLFFQFGDYDDYAMLNNYLSTPSVIIAVLLVYINLYILRKE